MSNKEGVSKETRKKVLKEAKRIGYRPNQLARELVTKQSNTIGVIIPDILNPFFAEIAKGILEEASIKGYTALLCVTNWDVQLEKKYIKNLEEKRVEGIIIKPCEDEQKLEDSINTPYVILEGNNVNSAHSCVEVDNEKGGYIGTKHLIECGYRKIAYVGGKKYAYSNEKRLKGYKRALAENNIDLDENLILSGEFDSKSGYELAKTALADNPHIDGIFCGNDVMALGVLHYANQAGINIPEELGVVGFDDISYASLPQIELTTVYQPKYNLGKLAVNTLLDDIKEGKEKTLKRIILQPDLIKRKTTRKI
ncbi:hypothetical protein CCE28_16490 [Anaeromicrobium sediminis]|uniref:HTH lacI-type domain-containing protein n=1 Tax=Anaeromicrobium sediminis TaxID=1478221 RepID=A0A267MH80_9FIRM|nr:hypothetical protein CCE28_16490 [Anaeromicrobium sediminis]